MLTIYGIPISVHTRKTLVTANFKGLDYKVSQVLMSDKVVTPSGDTNPKGNPTFGAPTEAQSSTTSRMVGI